MVVVKGSIEIVDFVVLVIDGPKVVVCAVAGKDEVGSILEVGKDTKLKRCVVNESVGVAAEVIAGDMGFLMTAKNEMYFINMQMKTY